MQVAGPRVDDFLIFISSAFLTPQQPQMSGREGQVRKPHLCSGNEAGAKSGQPAQEVLLYKYQPGYGLLGFMIRGDVVSLLTCKLSHSTVNEQPSRAEQEACV